MPAYSPQLSEHNKLNKQENGGTVPSIVPNNCPPTVSSHESGQRRNGKSVMNSCHANELNQSISKLSKLSKVFKTIWQILLENLEHSPNTFLVGLSINHLAENHIASETNYAMKLFDF